MRPEIADGLGPERVSNVTLGPQPGSPPPPTNFRLYQTLTAVKLRWRNPNYMDIKGYLIEARHLKLSVSPSANNDLGKISQTEGSEWHPIVILRNGPQESYDLSFTHLSPSSQYNFRLMAFNDIGVSEPAFSVTGPSNSPNGGLTVITTPAHLELR